MKITDAVERRKAQAPRKSDIRSDFARDLSRLIHSSAFRRLQAKTQVLGLGESDFYRTRLTHSMEVAQIGVSLNEFVRKKHRNDPIIKKALPSQELINGICLAHDIGHPPFGHGGEVALNVCMRNQGGFEGNGQTLRILTRLDKYHDKYGLNPTRRLLLGILKYPVAYSEVVNEKSYGELETTKWQFVAEKQKPPKCYMTSENDIVQWILDPLSNSDQTEFTRSILVEGKHGKSIYKSLDCSIMDAADDISYSVHDLEDALSLGMISQTAWTEHCKKSVFSDCGLCLEKVTSNLFGESHERKEQIGELINLMITSSFIAEREQQWSSPLLRYQLKLGTQAEELRKHLFNLVFAKVILNENVQQLEYKGQKLVIELFDTLSSDPKRLLPASTRKVFIERGSDPRVICDYIAGMTDDYATRFYEKLFLPRKGSIFDQL
jgi:dGTPase